MEKCIDCPKYKDCKQPCDEVNKKLWEDNRVMERHYSDRIVCYPQRNEIHLSALSEAEEASLSGAMPWSSGNTNLTKTAVFIERFFNNTPYKELAEHYRVNENTIVCMYRDAVKSIAKIIEVLDSRKEGLKAMKPDRFTQDEKIYLLVRFFNFTQNEVAGMFGPHRGAGNNKIKRLDQKYAGALRPFKSAYDGLTSDEMRERIAPG